jgi:hypothetical protein
MKAQIRTMIVVLSALLIMACAQSPVGIFQSIEREREILDDRNLDNGLNVGAVAFAEGRYFIAAGDLYHRLRDDVDYVANNRQQWSTLTAPGAASENYTTVSLVAFDPDGAGAETDQIYAVYRSQDANASGVYHIDPATPTLDTTPLFGTDDGVEAVVGVFVATDASGDLLIVPVRTGLSAYSVYYSSNAVDFNPVAGMTTNQPVIGVASNGADVVLLTSTVAYQDGDTIAGGGAPTPIADVDPDSGVALSGVYFQASSSVWWVGDGDGHLYSSPNLTDWTTNPTAYEISSDNDDPVPFTVFVEVNDTTQNQLLVGTDGFGYRILGAEADVSPKSPIRDGSNYEASELADAAILSWYVDPTLLTSYPVPTEPGADPYTTHDGYMLFAGTSKSGLWHALSFDGPIQWVRE